MQRTRVSFYQYIAIALRMFILVIIVVFIFLFIVLMLLWFSLLFERYYFHMLVINTGTNNHYYNQY